MDDIQYIGTKLANPSLSSKAISSQDPFSGSRPQPLAGIILHVDETKDEPAYCMLFRRVNATTILVGRRPPSADPDKRQKDVDSGKAMFKCPVVSRKHAQITFSDSGLAYIMDTGSHHGTHLLKKNEFLHRMLQPNVATLLSDGDFVTFGKAVGKNENLVMPVSCRVELLPAIRSASQLPGSQVMPLIITDDKERSPSPAPRSSDSSYISTGRGRFGVPTSGSSDDSLSDADADAIDSDVEVLEPSFKPSPSVAWGKLFTSFGKLGPPLAPLLPPSTSQSHNLPSVKLLPSRDDDELISINGDDKDNLSINSSMDFSPSPVPPPFSPLHRSPSPMTRDDPGNEEAQNETNPSIIGAFPGDPFDVVDNTNTTTNSSADDADADMDYAYPGGPCPAIDPYSSPSPRVDVDNEYDDPSVSSSSPSPPSTPPIGAYTAEEEPTPPPAVDDIVQYLSRPIAEAEEVQPLSLLPDSCFIREADDPVVTEELEVNKREMLVGVEEYVSEVEEKSPSPLHSPSPPLRTPSSFFDEDDRDDYLMDAILQYGPPDSGPPPVQITLGSDSATTALAQLGKTVEELKSSISALRDKENASVAATTKHDTKFHSIESELDALHEMYSDLNDNIACVSSDISEAQESIDGILRLDVPDLQVQMDRFEDKFVEEQDRVADKFYHEQGAREKMNERIDEEVAKLYTRIGDDAAQMTGRMDTEVAKLHTVVESLKEAHKTTLNSLTTVQAEFDAFKSLHQVSLSTVSELQAEARAVKSAREQLLVLMQNVEAQIQQAQTAETPVPTVSVSASVGAKRKRDGQDDEFSEEGPESGVGDDGADHHIQMQEGPNSTTTVSTSAGIVVPAFKRPRTPSPPPSMIVDNSKTKTRKRSRTRRIASVVARTATMVTVGAVFTWTALAFS